MSSNSHARSVGIFALCFLISCCAVHAAVVEQEGGGGGGPGGGAEIDWNPHLSCYLSPLTDEELFICLFASANGNAGCDPWVPPGGPGGPDDLFADDDPEDLCVVHYGMEDFVVAKGGGHLKILRTDYEEIDRLRFRETYRNMTKTHIKVERDGLQAEIMMIEDPDLTWDPDGRIEVTLNGRTVQLNTKQGGSTDLTTALWFELQKNWFAAELLDDYIVVDWDFLGNGGITDVTFAAYDPWIVGSEIALESEGSPPGGP